eukprot:TRINITY_DN27942_c0_g2_i1.p1 TRINITY_DN27942_c0_g2~~TRINITY_DN27942_c0_g2_i1.p1  ORF type:complete len:862 (+),score=145.49 TRINITY_DN27942_c0_g2_i1:115-2700(+)
MEKACPPLSTSMAQHRWTSSAPSSPGFESTMAEQPLAIPLSCVGSSIANGLSLEGSVQRDLGQVRVGLEQLRQRQLEFSEGLAHERLRRESLERLMLDRHEDLKLELGGVRQVCSSSMDGVRKSTQDLLLGFEDLRVGFEELRSRHQELQHLVDEHRWTDGDQLGVLEQQLRTVWPQLEAERTLREQDVQKLREHIRTQHGEIWSAIGKTQVLAELVPTSVEDLRKDQRKLWQAAEETRKAFLEHQSFGSRQLHDLKSQIDANCKVYARDIRKLDDSAARLHAKHDEFSVEYQIGREELHSSAENSRRIAMDCGLLVEQQFQTLRPELEAECQRLELRLQTVAKAQTASVEEELQRLESRLEGVSGDRFASVETLLREAVERRESDVEENLLRLEARVQEATDNRYQIVEARCGDVDSAQAELRCVVEESRQAVLESAAQVAQQVRGIQFQLEHARSARERDSAFLSERVQAAGAEQEGRLESISQELWAAVRSAEIATSSLRTEAASTSNTQADSAETSRRELWSALHAAQADTATLRADATSSMEKQREAYEKLVSSFGALEVSQQQLTGGQDALQAIYERLVREHKTLEVAHQELAGEHRCFQAAIANLDERVIAAEKTCVVSPKSTTHVAEPGQVTSPVIRVIRSSPIIIPLSPPVQANHELSLTQPQHLVCNAQATSTSGGRVGVGAKQPQQVEVPVEHEPVKGHAAWPRPQPLFRASRQEPLRSPAGAAEACTSSLPAASGCGVNGLGCDVAVLQVHRSASVGAMRRSQSGPHGAAATAGGAGGRAGLSRESRPVTQCSSVRWSSPAGSKMLGWQCSNMQGSVPVGYVAGSQPSTVSSWSCACAAAQETTTQFFS